MRLTDEVFQSLIEQLYDAAAQPARWPDFLAAYARAVGGKRAVLSFFDDHNRAGTVAANTQLDPEASKLWAEHYVNIDPWLIHGTKRGLMRTGFAAPGQVVVSHHTLTRTEFFNDYGRQFGIVHGLGAIVLKERHKGGVITVLRDESDHPFDAAETSFVRGLVPHMQRALALHMRLSTLDRQQRVFGEALEHASFGVLILSRDQRVLHANKLAQDALSALDGLRATQERLSVMSRDHDGRFRELVDGAARQLIDTPRRECGGFVAVPRPSGKSPYVMFVTPLRIPHGALEWPSQEEQPCVAVFIHDPDSKPPGLDQRLRDVFGLSNAEAAVGVGLLEGQTLEEVAEQLCISRHTAKSHLRQIFQKTDTRRQAEFIRRALAIDLLGR